LQLTYAQHQNIPYKVHCCFQVAVVVAYWLFFTGVVTNYKSPWHTQMNVCPPSDVFIYVRVILKSTIADTINTKVRSCCPSF